MLLSSLKINIPEIKNSEKVFQWLMACKAHVCWSKYTTHMYYKGGKLVKASWSWGLVSASYTNSEEVVVRIPVSAILSFVWTNPKKSREEKLSRIMRAWKGYVKKGGSGERGGNETGRRTWNGYEKWFGLFRKRRLNG